MPSQRAKPSLQQLLEAVDETFTIYDILYAINYLKKERLRSKAKNAKRSRQKIDQPAQTPAETSA
jgi:hypothetical protein